MFGASLGYVEREVWGGGRGDIISTVLSMFERPLHSGRGSSPQEQAEIPGRMEKEERFPGLHTVPILQKRL